jgi:hypothetical protein
MAAIQLFSLLTMSEKGLPSTTNIFVKLYCGYNSSGGLGKHGCIRHRILHGNHSPH